MVGIMQYFASRHFTDYVAKVELERLADVVTSLKQEYRASRGWHRLMQDQSLWERMTRFSRPEDRMERPPLPPRPLDSDRRMEPSLEGNGPPPGSHRLSLYDDKKQLIVGWRDEFSNQVTREIKIDGKTVGWLGLSRPRHTTDPLQLNFFYQQMRGLYPGWVRYSDPGRPGRLSPLPASAPADPGTGGGRSCPVLPGRFDTRVQVSFIG